VTSTPATADQRPAHGGVPARRAMIRWSWRMLRREWRSQLLLVVLLTVAVAFAVCGTTALNNAPAKADPTYGKAKSAWLISGQGSQAVAADLAKLRDAYGDVDVIARTVEKVPGLAQGVEYRAQAMHGKYTGDLLAIHRGRYPHGAGEAAITNDIATLLDLRLGGSIALDGHPRTIVGIAENPSRLTDKFVLVSPDGAPPAQTVSVLGPSAQRHRVSLPGVGTIGIGANNNAAVITTLALGGTSILLLLVSFVAAAGFAVMAHRRLRQLGILAALGATDRHVRLVMTATGVLVGAIAACLGTAIGLAAWPPVGSLVETASDHRVDLLNVPWSLIAGVAVLAVAMSAVAAWWPARAVSRLPATVSLSGRPPVPAPTRRSALLAALSFAAGVACLAIGGTRRPLFVVVGIVATALAMLLIGPATIRMLGAAGRRAPVAVRLAVRDLVRHQGRSSAAVAAISLAIGIPMATVIIAGSGQPSASGGNLNDHQLVVSLGDPGDPPDAVPSHTDAELRNMGARVDDMAAGLARPTVVPLDVAHDPTAPLTTSPFRGVPAWQVYAGAVQLDAHSFAEEPMYVATPALIRLLGGDPSQIPSSTDVITSRSQPIVSVSPGNDRRPIPLATTRVKGTGYSALPHTLLTTAAMARRQLTPIRAGWLIESAKPLSGSQIADARRLAAEAGLTVEARDGRGTVNTIRLTATAIGMLLALAVLAMTVGLVRSEGEADLRTLTAAGATGSIRRTLTATTAGSLAALGVALGAAGAGLGLVAVYRHDLAVFGRVPPAYPLAILLGVPLLAAAAGWLLAGQAPPAIARRMSEY
jgi:putative ABC transport system permease protein